MRNDSSTPQAKRIVDAAQAATEAAAASEEVGRRIAAVEAQVCRYRTLFDPTVARMTNAPSPTVEESLRARRDLPALEQQLAELELLALEAMRRAVQARAVWRAEVKAAFDEDVQTLRREAVTALRLATVAMGRLHARQERFHTETGTAFMDPMALAVLLPTDSLAAAWLARNEAEL